MAHGSQARGRSPGSLILVVILVIIAILAIVAGILYLTEPAKSLPAILGTITHPASRANAHRSLRGWTALAVGVIFLVGPGSPAERADPHAGDRCSFPPGDRPRAGGQQPAIMATWWSGQWSLISTGC